LEKGAQNGAPGGLRLDKLDQPLRGLLRITDAWAITCLPSIVSAKKGGKNPTPQSCPKAELKMALGQPHGLSLAY